MRIITWPTQQHKLVWVTATALFTKAGGPSTYGLTFTPPMANVHSPATRSYNMSRIRSTNTKPEMLARRYLHTEHQ